MQGKGESTQRSGKPKAFPLRPLRFNLLRLIRVNSCSFVVTIPSYAFTNNSRPSHAHR